MESDIGEAFAQPDDRLVTIVTIWNRPEMLTFAAMLDAHGIPLFISGEWHASADPISFALGGFEIRVPAAFAEQAIALSTSLSQEPPIEGSLALRNRIWLLMGVCTALTLGIFFPVAWPMTRGEYVISLSDA